MRVAVTFRNGRLAGGIETYLHWLIPELCRAGHDLAFLFEQDQPATCPKIGASSEVMSLCVEQLGRDGAVSMIRKWKPDVVFNNGLWDPKLETKLIEGANAVYYSHNYSGACISGHKGFARPVARPCHKPFGRRCLLWYFPRRCGGLNPLNMLSLYAAESERLALLSRYRAVITNSDYVRREYIRLGLNGDSITTLHPFISAQSEDAAAVPGSNGGGGARRSGTRTWPSDNTRQLLFVGRMMPQKGVGLLLEALPEAAGTVGKPLRLVLAGDGPARSAFESHARRVQARHPSLEIAFKGWLEGRDLVDLMRSSDLLVVPSWWPEPFGLVGPEAGLQGLPAAAFAVGGIPEWLVDGVNGHLAPAEPPTAAGLAEAIAKCLCDPAEHERLKAGAFEVAQGYTSKKHIKILSSIFEEAIA